MIGTVLAGAVLLLVSLSGAGCDTGGDTRFTTNLASDFTPAGHSVSVLGLFKDGKMSPDGLETVAPYLAGVMGSDACGVGYQELASANVPLAEAIDEYARTDGPSDDLVAQVAPAAKGDLILIVTLAGKLPHRAPPADAGAAPSTASSPPTGGRGGGRGMRGGRTGGPPRAESPKDTNALDLSAMLYSVAERRAVALVALEYSGATLSDALKKFGDKLAQVLPRARCVDWNWDVKLDPEAIRKSIDE